MNALAPVLPTISPKGLKAMAWIHNTPHHFGRWLCNGRDITTEPPEEWTHFQLKGRRWKQLTMPVDLKAEIDPYITVSESDTHMFGLSDKGVAILAREGLLN